MQIIFTVGVSASGKTTWANNFIEEKKKENESWININQDDIRLLIIKEEKGNNIDEAIELKKWNYDPNGSSQNKLREYWCKSIFDSINKDYQGIIVSDTNLDGGVEKIEILTSYGIDKNNIFIVEFPISFEEALERDKNRKFSVGEAVLKMQFDKLELLKKNQSRNKLTK